VDVQLLYRVEAGLAMITLNRPEKLNALSRAMVAEIRRIATAVEQDPDIFALVITGTGRGFCSGHEIEAVLAATDRPATAAATRAAPALGTAARSAPAFDGAAPAAAYRRPSAPAASDTATRDAVVSAAPADPRELPALFSFLLSISKPVFAAINGVTAAGGFVLAMMCDMRFASEAASFTVGFSNRGLVAEHGLSWLLPRQIGTSRALDLLWSSRRVSAEEALRIGLVDRVVPAGRELEEVISYVSEMRAKVSPRALAEIKSQVYADLSASFISAVLESERRTQLSLAHPDVREGARSFMERRPPRFQPWAAGK
jgi:enoyl-CoA hydratase/carnithine racemase